MSVRPKGSWNGRGWPMVGGTLDAPCCSCDRRTPVSVNTETHDGLVMCLSCQRAKQEHAEIQRSRLDRIQELEEERAQLLAALRRDGARRERNETETRGGDAD